jgi:hypothetical protein
VLGIKLPRGVRNLNAKSLNVKNLAKQIGDMAEQLEHTSEDVRNASATAKRASKSLS